MGTYILDCSEPVFDSVYEQLASIEGCIFAPNSPCGPNHIHFPALSLGLADEDVRTFPLSADKIALILSFSFTKRSKSVSIAVILASIIILEVLALSLVHLRQSGTLFALPTLIQWLLFSIYSPMCIVLFFAPAIVFGIFRAFARIDERSIASYIQHHAIPIATTSKHNGYLFFPGDSIIIQAAVVALISVQLKLLFGGLSFLIFLFPIMILLTAFLLLDVITTYSYHHAASTGNPYTFWKTRAALAGFPVLVQFFSSLLCMSTLALVAILFYADASVKRSEIEFTSDAEYAKAIFEYNISELADQAQREMYPAIAQDAVAVVITYTPVTRYVVLVPLMIIVILPLLAASSLFGNWQSDGDILNFDARNIESNYVRYESALVTKVLAIILWLVALVLAVVALVMSSMTLLWLVDHTSGWVFREWALVLALYEAGLVEIFGVGVGRTLAATSLLFLGLPSCILGMVWLASIATWITRPVWLRRHYSQDNEELGVMVTAVLAARGIGGAPPRVVVDRHEDFASTIALAPMSRGCVIRVAEAATRVLTPSQLEMVLAHELSHVRLHARRLWGLQLLSQLSLLGPGYLTLLTDYWRMEHEADEWASWATRKRRAFMELLERLDDLMYKVRIEALVQQQMERSSIGYVPIKRSDVVLKGVILRIFKVYKRYYGANFWGYSHPAVADRLEYMRFRLEGIEKARASQRDHA